MAEFERMVISNDQLCANAVEADHLIRDRLDDIEKLLDDSEKYVIRCIESFDGRKCLDANDHSMFISLLRQTIRTLQDSKTDMDALYVEKRKLESVLSILERGSLTE